MWLGRVRGCDRRPALLPGGPTRVVLDDRIAEHVPGCNMAFRRDALLAIGGFNPIYLRAGDDVDVCWRLQARGWKIGFSPAAIVWHRHRATVRAYWRQQAGDGEGGRGAGPEAPRRVRRRTAARSPARRMAPHRAAPRTAARTHQGTLRGAVRARGARGGDDGAVAAVDRTRSRADGRPSSGPPVLDGVLDEPAGAPRPARDGAAASARRRPG